MNKKILGVLMAGMLTVSLGGVSAKAYDVRNVQANNVQVQSVNGNVNLQVPKLSDGVYDVNVNLLKSGTESTSMAQDMIDYAELSMKNGEATLVLYVKPIKKLGFVGHAKTLSYFNGTVKCNAEVTSVKDGNPTVFSFKLPAKGLSEDKFKVSMTTDVNVAGISMGKELSADMQIDFSKIL